MELMLILIAFFIVTLRSRHDRIDVDSYWFFLISFLIVILPSGHDRIYADSHFFSHSYSALRAWQGLCWFSGLFSFLFSSLFCSQGRKEFVLILIVILLAGHDRVHADSYLFSHLFSHRYSALRAWQGWYWFSSLFSQLHCPHGMTGFMLILIAFLIVTLPSGHDSCLCWFSFLFS